MDNKIAKVRRNGVDFGCVADSVIRSMRVWNTAITLEPQSIKMGKQWLPMAQVQQVSAARFSLRNVVP